MNQLNEYFRLKEVDRKEMERLCMIDLKKVIDICIKRNYTFSINGELALLNVTIDNEFEKTTYSYYKGTLIGYEDVSTMTVKNLLHKLRTQHKN